MVYADLFSYSYTIRPTMDSVCRSGYEFESNMTTMVTLQEITWRDEYKIYGYMLNIQKAGPIEPAFSISKHI